MDEEEATVVTYGMRYIVMSIEKFLCFLILGGALKCGKEVIVVLAVFGSVRLFAGGFHMKTNWECTLMMGVVVGTSVTLGRALVEDIIIVIALWIVSSILIYCFAPADCSGRRRWTETERKKKKVNAILVVSVWYLIAALMLIGNEVLGNIIIVACLIEALTLLPITEGRKI